MADELSMLRFLLDQQKHDMMHPQNPMMNLVNPGMPSPPPKPLPDLGMLAQGLQQPQMTQAQPPRSSGKGRSMLLGM